MLPSLDTNEDKNGEFAATSLALTLCHKRGYLTTGTTLFEANNCRSFGRMQRKLARQCWFMHLAEANQFLYIMKIICTE